MPTWNDVLAFVGPVVWTLLGLGAIIALLFLYRVFFWLFDKVSDWF